MIKKRILFSIFLLLQMRHVDAATPQPAAEEKTYIVQETKVMSEPSFNAEAILKLRPGLELEILEYHSSDSWMKIKTPKGSEGWIQVKSTALAGRRDRPLIPAYDLPEEESNRQPASVDGDGDEEKTPPPKTTQKKLRVRAAPAPHTFDQGIHFLGELHFNQQLEPFRSPGFGANAGFVYATSVQLRLGLLGGWDYNYDSAQNSSTQVTRTQHHFFVGPLVGVLASQVYFEGAVGLDMLRTNIAAYDVPTGARLPAGTPGDLSGDYSESAVGARLSAAYTQALVQGEGSIGVFYQMGFYTGDSLVGAADTTAFPQSLGIFMRYGY